MWFEVEGYDASGKLIYSEGKIEDGALEPEPGAHPCMMRDVILDEHGELTHMFWEAADRNYLDETVPTAVLGMQHVKSCYFSPRLVQPIQRLQLRLRMRAMGLDVLSDSERTQDCSSYACAIYPGGPGCATQGPTAGHAP